MNRNVSSTAPAHAGAGEAQRQDPTENQSAVPSVLALMSLSAGIAAANIYYAQPLLPRMAVDFGIAASTMALLPAVTQVGFAIGILTIVPLADMVERRRLLLIVLTLLSMVLLVHAFASSVEVLFVAAFGLGLVGITPQLLAPFAALLAPRGKEGAAVGVVLSGVFSGIVLSRVFAGGVAQWFGWRGVFLAAGVGALMLAALLRLKLPRSLPATRIGYGQLISSSFLLLRDEPRLRRHVIYGALSFASFMTFWSTYAVHVETVFDLGAAGAGLFGFAGVAGVVGASLAGSLVDRGRFSTVCILGALVMVAGFCVLAAGRNSVIAIALGAILLDGGASVTHAANQSKALTLRPGAIARVNSIYISGYFVGGAIGTSAAGIAYAYGGWLATCSVGACFSGAMLISEIVRSSRFRNRAS